MFGVSAEWCKLQDKSGSDNQATACHHDGVHHDRAPGTGSEDHDGGHNEEHGDTGRLAAGGKHVDIPELGPSQFRNGSNGKDTLEQSGPGDLD